MTDIIQGAWHGAIAVAVMVVIWSALSAMGV